MRKVVTLLLLSLFFLCGFVKAPQQSVTTIESPDSSRCLFLYTEGIKRNLIYGDTVQAQQLFAKALEQDSTYAPAHYELAGILLYNDSEQAIRHARSAAELDSTNRWYRQLYGQTLIVGKRYAEALPVFEHLVRTERNPDHYRLLALLYDYDRRPFSAIAILDSAERQFGINPYLGEMKRQLLLSTHQYDRALEEAQKVVESIPYEPANHIALGEVYALMQSDSLAEAAFRKAVEIDPESAMAWAALGEHYNRRGDTKAYLNTTYKLFKLSDIPVSEKLSMLRQLTANRRFYRDNYPQIDILATTLHNAHPDHKEVTQMFADHLISSGKIDEALALFKAQTRAKDADRDSFTTVMEIESYLGHADSVTLYLNRALEHFPNDAELYVRQGLLHLINKNFDEAFKGYVKAMRYADNDTLRSTIWGYLGDLCHQKATEGNETVTEGAFGTRSANRTERKQMKLCYECYDKALALNPENSGVLNNYAYFLSLEERDLERALEMSERANSLTTNNPTFLDTQAWILHKLGRNDEAKRLMRQAISLDATNSADLQLHYGDILAALGEKFMAEVYWRKALDNGYDKASIEERLNSLKQKQ
ncbi:MAG: tetratricopeptide repeat protein [Alistipes sp.]|nr:tetratricopeptide repeat protein [Alistipes sp.]